MHEMFCSKCNETVYVQLNELFHSICGTQLKQKGEVLPYVGVSLTAGIYEIICTARSSFSSKESADDAARHSSYNEGDSFKTYKSELVQPFQNPTTHPYLCNSCYEYVSQTSEGFCHGCGGKAWSVRSDTTTCSLCEKPCPTKTTLHLHQGTLIGECCWDDRLKASE